MEILAFAFILAQAASTAPPTPSPGPTPAGTPTQTPAVSRPAAPRKLTGGFGLRPTPRGPEAGDAETGAAASGAPRGTFSIAGPRTTPPPEARPTSAAEKVAPSEEATWRARVAGLRADLEQAEKDYARADAANTVVGWGRPGRDYETLMAIRNAALTPYLTRLAEIRAALAALPEECRTTPGCQPGWVR